MAAGAKQERPAGAEAYSSRESTSTRNPHASGKQISASELAKLSPEERVLAQWKAAYGTPISDEAKTQFSISACGHTFSLADVRLWQDHHKNKADKVNVIYLEFFFDGMLGEVQGKEEEFHKAFETMVEKQLQEVRATEFRKRLTARRRASASRAVAADAEGGSSTTPLNDDPEWREYLKRPVPATNLSIQSMREAGCMLRFLVCQTSISWSGAEVLGQIAFQEQFPIDGVAQEPSKSSKPMPTWVYGMMCCTVGFATITVAAWWQIVKAVLAHGEGLVPLLE